MDGWKTSVSFWEGLFSGAMLVSGGVVNQLFSPIPMLFFGDAEVWQ